MKTTLKKTLLAGAITVAVNISVATAAAHASGPVMPIMPMAPVAPPQTVVPVTVTKTVLSPAAMKANALNNYRKLRAFWLSRAIVR